MSVSVKEMINENMTVTEEVLYTILILKGQSLEIHAIDTFC